MRAGLFAEQLARRGGVFLCALLGGLGFAAGEGRAAEPMIWLGDAPAGSRIDFGYGRKRETGIKIGKGRLHGALNAGIGYDSNALFSDAGSQGDLSYQVSPGADFSWGTAKFDLGVGYRYSLLGYARNTVQNSLDQHRVHFDSRYRITRRLRAAVSDSFEASSDPADVEIPERLGRLTNAARGEVGYQTPGEDLDVSLGYTNTFQRFDNSLPLASFYNNKESLTSRVDLAARFRFLPNSAATGNFEYGRTSFKNDPAYALANNDSQGFSFSLGLTSQVTRRVGANARAGLSWMDFTGGPDALAATGGAGIAFLAKRKLTLEANYEHGQSISTFTNYYTSDRVSAGARWRFARKLEANLRNSVYWLKFSGPNGNLDGALRRDFVEQLSAGVGWEFISWGRLKTEYLLDYRDSNATDPTGNFSANFTKHRVNVGVDLYY